MSSVYTARSIVKSIVPISRFDEDEASDIFGEVRECGTKVVVKDNQPECILLSPDVYEQLLEELEDAELLAVAKERLSQDNIEWISHEEMMARYGITQEDLDNMEDVEIE